MSEGYKPPVLLTFGAIIASSLGIFIIDLRAPAGVAWMGYVIPLLWSGFWRRPGLPFLLASVFSVLMLISGRLSSPGMSFHPGQADRLIGMAVLWMVALIEFKRLQAGAQLRESVAKRELAEKTLAESEERYHRLFNEMTEGFALHEILCDGSGRPSDYRFLEINPSFERLTGLPREKVVGRLCSGVLPGEHPQWLERYGRVALTGEPVHFEDFSATLNRYYEVDAYCPAPRQFAVMFLDITARKRVEHLLQEQYLELENLYRSLPIGLSVVDHQFRFLKMNDRLAAINGRPAVEHLGRTIYEMIPDVAAALEPIYRRVFATGEAVCNIEFTRNFRMVPGEERNYLASYHPLKAKEGHVYGLCSVVVDITERKRTEQALVESEERFRSAMQHSAIGMAMVSPAGGFLEVNPALCRILGCEREVLLATDFQTITHPEDLPESLAFNKRLLQGEIQTFELEKRYRHQAGHYIWARVNVSLIRHRDGKSCSLVTQMQDITERKRAADELFQSREMLRMILDNIPQRVFWKDRELKFMGGNLLIARDCGFTDPAELIGKSDYDIIFQKTAEDFRSDDRQVMETNQPKLNYEELQIRPDGKTAHLMTSKVPLHDKDGRVIGVLGTYEDITERKALETQFRQAQKMEAVGRLAGGIAHDFNNLLTVISGYSNLLLAELPPEDGSVLFLTEIKKAGERASALTRQLLAFSRKQVLTPDNLNLNAVIGECENMLRRLLGEDIDFQLQLAADLGRVLADPNQLDQVLLNLVVNARDAMPQGGTLLIKTANATLDEHYCQQHPGIKPGPYVMLVVSDTGVGMDETTKALIFEPFFTTKQEGKGTGLGLAMVFGFIKQSGGHITVSSAPKHGSSFSIYLPEVRSAGVPGPPPGASPEVPSGSETILLVEDQNEVRVLARRMLQKRGYQVLEASHGAEAVRMVEAHPGTIHLLISDVVMPGMGGRQTAEKIVALRPQIKVLFMSGYTDDAVMRHGIHSAETNFLHKPFTGEALHRKVRKILDQ